MANDPQIVYPQNPVTSVAVLTNIVGGVITWAVVKYGLGSILTPDLQNQIATMVALAIMGLANLIVRKYFTSGPLSFDAPMTQTPSQPLPAGSAVVVATSPSPSPAAAVVTPLPPGSHTVTVPDTPPPAPPPPAVTVNPAP
jgi:hypothetical protein